MKREAIMMAGVLAMGAAMLAVPAAAATRSSVIAYVPHQDDEALILAPAALRLREQGHELYLALVTDGGATKVCAERGMTRSECTAARDAEFRRSAAALGVDEAHLVFVKDDSGRRLPDGALTYDQARYAVSRAVSAVRYRDPNQPVIGLATSWTDPHPDHAVIGRALRDSGVEAVRFALKDFGYERAPVPAGYDTVAMTPANTAPYFAALNAYRTSQEQIGYPSVPAAFDYRAGVTSALVHHR